MTNPPDTFEKRQWWIAPVSDAILDEPPFPEWKENGEWVHVIEKSAYDALAAEYKDEIDHCSKSYQEVGVLWSKAEDKLKILTEALEAIITAWKAKQWKGQDKYWSNLGSMIAAAREPLAKVSENTDYGCTKADCIHCPPHNKASWSEWDGSDD